MREPFQGNECLNAAHEAVGALRAARRECEEGWHCGRFSIDVAFRKAIKEAEHLAYLLEHIEVE